MRRNARAEAASHVGTGWQSCGQRETSALARERDPGHLHGSHEDTKNQGPQHRRDGGGSGLRNQARRRSGGETISNLSTHDRQAKSGDPKRETCRAGAACRCNAAGSRRKESRPPHRYPGDRTSADWGKGSDRILRGPRESSEGPGRDQGHRFGARP